MYVRLAFSVAAHLESEIMIVDEVLAVGDADFQKKCINKMDSVSRQEGRTVLFVSHNMASIQNLCNNAIFLEQGNLMEYGKTNIVINDYLKRKKEAAQAKIKSIQLNEIIFQHLGFNNNFDDEIIIKQGENLVFSFDMVNLHNTNEGIPVTCFGNQFQHQRIIAKPASKQKNHSEFG